VNVTGANDTPTLSDLNIGKLADTATADSFATLAGHLTGSDVDTGDTLTYAVLNADAHGTATGLYGSLTVNADGSYSYVPNAAAINALSSGDYTDTFTVQTTDAHNATGRATLTVDVTGANDAPVINVDQISVTQDRDEQVVVHGLSVTDADAGANETFTIAAATEDPSSNVSPSSATGSLADINSTLHTITYNEGSGEPSTDKVTLTVTDGHGATDTVNLIFNLAESADDHVSLDSTTGKDVLFGTGYQDQFVFAANSNHDTIVNFTSGQDHIDLSFVNASNVSNWMAQHVAASGADTLITIDAADTILLKGVGSVQASDFILHVT
jgi:VCBS repeat-containing protein